MKTLVLTKYGKMFAPTIAHFAASGWDDMALIAAGFANWEEAAAGECPIKFTPEVVKEMRHHFEREFLAASRNELEMIMQIIATRQADVSREVGAMISENIGRINTRLAALGVPHPGEMPYCRSASLDAQFAGRGIRPAPPMPADPVPGDDDE